MRRELGARAYHRHESNWSYCRQVLRETPCEQRTEPSAGEARVSTGQAADAERRADEAWGMTDYLSQYCTACRCQEP